MVAHSQPDSSHPDFEVCNENLAILRASTDARGRQLEVVEIEAPTVTHADGDIVDWSYINHYVCNGAVILCSFSDSRDEEAAATLSKLYPGREVVSWSRPDPSSNVVAESTASPNNNPLCDGQGSNEG